MGIRNSRFTIMCVIQVLLEMMHGMPNRPGEVPGSIFQLLLMLLRIIELWEASTLGHYEVVLVVNLIGFFVVRVRPIQFQFSFSGFRVCLALPGAFAGILGGKLLVKFSEFVIDDVEFAGILVIVDFYAYTFDVVGRQGFWKGQF